MRERVLELITWRSAVWAQRVILTGLLVANALMGLGTAWDIHWHAAVGRDSVWIPPHMMVYLGVALAGALGAFATVLAGADAAGYRVVAAGGAVMAFAAVFDAFWHRAIGDQTIWSPPHTLGVAGAVAITLGSIVAHLRAGRRLVLSPPLARAGAVVLFAALFIASFFGLLPATVMAFLPEVKRLPFVTTTNPYVVAALAALTVPAVAACSREVLGRRGFEMVALVGLGFWIIQEVVHVVMTPLIAAAFGYDVNPRALPDFRFRLLTLIYMLTPAAVGALVPGRLGREGVWLAGALLGALYAGGVAVWLAGLRMESGLSVLAAGIPIAVGAAAAAAGARGGQWIRGASSAGTGADAG
ncbi:MAG: hypothetical protein HY660_09290 [Armatimonadetes bacterium]|nr:hypothetical protein [Armatimonadota bacterium]